jgi:Creatinine amidohydrolase
MRVYWRTCGGGEMTTTKKLNNIRAVACIVAALVLPGSSQSHISKKPIPKIGVYKIEELTAPEIDRLDRNKTLFILPVGVLEEHGPHLPIGTDTYLVNFGVEGTAKHLQRNLSDWTIIMLPDLNYGEGGANGFSGNPVHPGTYGIRYTTLRSVVADVGGQIAQPVCCDTPRLRHAGRFPQWLSDPGISHRPEQHVGGIQALLAVWPSGGSAVGVGMRRSLCKETGLGGVLRLSREGQFSFRKRVGQSGHSG